MGREIGSNDVAPEGVSSPTVCEPCLGLGEKRRRIIVVARWIITASLIVLVTSCGSSNSANRSDVVVSTAPAGSASQVTTKVCGRPIFIAPRRVSVISLLRSDVLKVQEEGPTHLAFRVAESCDSGTTIALRPSRCAQVALTVNAPDGKPVAVQVRESCSFRAFVSGRLVARVHVVHHS